MMVLQTLFRKKTHSSRYILVWERLEQSSTVSTPLGLGAHILTLILENEGEGALKGSHKIRMSAALHPQLAV